MIYVWIQSLRLKRAMDKDDEEAVYEITRSIMQRIADQLSRITRQYREGVFYGLLMANATMWCEAMKEDGDEQDEHICKTVLKKTSYKVEG